MSPIPKLSGNNQSLSLGYFVWSHLPFLNHGSSQSSFTFPLCYPMSLAPQRFCCLRRSLWQNKSTSPVIFRDANNKNGETGFFYPFELEEYQQHAENRCLSLTRETQTHVISENDKENLADLHPEKPTVSKLTYWQEEADFDPASLMVLWNKMEVKANLVHSG